MGDVVNAINNVDFKILFTSLALCIAAVISGMKSLDYFLSRFGIETKKMREEREQKEDIEEIHKKIEEFETQRKEDAVKSEANDEELKRMMTEMCQKFDELSKCVGELKDKVHDMEEKNDERKRAELKDKIGQHYRYFHEKREWDYMEKEIFEGLVEEYKKVKGNSFVHDHIIPESYTWKLVDK